MVEVSDDIAPDEDFLEEYYPKGEKRVKKSTYETSEEKYI
jgi:hypothetical protein